MMQSTIAPCKKGDEIRDYEAMANLPAACNTPLRGSSPYHLDLNNKNARSVQAPAGSEMTGKVVVNQQEDVPLSAGFIAVVCICGIVLLFLFVFYSEIKSSLISLWLRRRQHNTLTSFNGQDVHADPSRAAHEGHAEHTDPNLSEVLSSNGSSAVASSVARLNDSTVAAGWKQGLTYWAIRGLPLIKYKKPKVQLLPSSNSASFVQFMDNQNMCSSIPGMITTPGTIDHDIESAPQLPMAFEAIHSDAAPDYNRLECVVCLSSFEEDEAVRVLPHCYHAFHAVCIDSWLLLHSTCPLCRAQISSLDECQE